MPVYSLQCPDCQHIFKGLVLEGTQEPKEWVCSKCGSYKAQNMKPDEHVEHPLEKAHGSGCPCCG